MSAHAIIWVELSFTCTLAPRGARPLAGAAKSSESYSMASLSRHKHTRYRSLSASISTERELGLAAIVALTKAKKQNVAKASDFIIMLKDSVSNIGWLPLANLG